MPNFRARVVITTAAASAIALGAMLVLAGPASAADTDPSPLRVISGTATTLNDVYGMTTAPDGTLYASSYDPVAVVSFPAAATGDVSPLTQLTGLATTLQSPYGISIDSAGDLWVSDKAADSIDEFAPGATGNTAPIARITGSNTLLDGPSDVAVAPDGSVYVVNYEEEQILVFAKNATGNVAPTRIIGGLSTDFSTYYPYGIVLQSDGTIVTTSPNDGIETFAADADGDAAPLYTIAGSATQLDDPARVVVDHSGNIYTANYYGESVTEYSKTATGDVAPIQRIAGSASELNGPYTVAMDASDDLYVSNYDASPDSVTVYAANLAVTNLTPATGATTGGGTVTIHGYGFAAGATVTFGGSAATDVHVTSSRTISAVVPAHAAGKVTVAVTHGGKTSTLADGYTYAVVLATTGVDPTLAMGAGILLFLVGGVLLIVRRRMGRSGRA